MYDTFEETINDVPLFIWYHQVNVPKFPPIRRCFSFDWDTKPRDPGNEKQVDIKIVKNKFQ